MKIHHLNCGTCCPLGGRLFDGVSAGLVGRLVCHCLLIETDAGLVLVDTGYGTREVRDHAQVPALFRGLNRPVLRHEETALAQVRALGFAPDDVRHIVISHLDFDHAGGIEDFPAATVHLMRSELNAARDRRGSALGTLRYQRQQWDEVRDWRCYAPSGERWMGFDAVRALDGLPPEILMVPLSGHTFGHAGVAVQRSDDWLFYAADVYFYRGEIETPPRRLSGTSAYQRMMDSDHAARRANQGRLRALQAERGSEIRVFCAHDATEYDVLAGFSP